MRRPAVMAGVFVGGAGNRMGGLAKGMLEAPEGGTLIERSVGLLCDAGVDRVVLVGRRLEYASLRLETIDDEPAGVGPMGGLAALLAQAESTFGTPSAAGPVRVLALACDMPFVSPALIASLLSAPDAPVVAPRREGRWEPLCARYDAREVLPRARRRIDERQFALQPLLSESGAVELSFAVRDELRDWDAPNDMLASRNAADSE